MNTATANLPAERKANYNSVAIESHGGGGMLRPSSLGEVVELAQLMAKADVAVPKHLRGNVGACVSVAMQAFRWEMDPFAVANKSYSVNDRLAYEAQLCAAVVNMRAPIVGRPDYLYSGEGVTRRCKVVCIMADGEVREYESPEFGKITTKNSPLWKSDPDQQLGYFAIRSWARRHAPEVLLGVYTPEELAAARDETIRDVTPRPSGLRERLAGPGAEGFSTAQAEHIAPAEPVDFAEAAEHVEAIVEEIEAEPDPVDEPAPEAEAKAESDFPGDRPYFDVLAWADKLERELPDYASVDIMRLDWNEHKAELQARDPLRCKALNLAIATRAQEIGAGQ